MKKIIVAALSLAFVIVLLSACSQKSTHRPTAVNNVSIGISDVSSAGATVIIKDTNEEPYVYGEWYKIEKEKSGQWYEVDTIIDSYGFTEIGYLPNNNDEVKFTVDWKWLYGELPTGNYRIIKEVDNQYISVEFSI